MSQDPDPDKLSDLEARLEKVRAAKRAKETAAPVGKDYRGADLAWRMVIELVSGLGIGFGIGFGLDTVFGTMPFLLVLFILLGFAAGVKTMLRSAREFQEQRLAAEAAREDEGR